MARIALTRESILDGTLHASVRTVLGPDVPFMSDAQRRAQIDAMLARAPAPGRTWVFAFGSLIWNPAFHYAERRVALVHGWHRRFCLWVHAGRGTPERPGLMLSLESGGSCRGVGYRLAAGTEAVELDVLWRREMFTLSYRPVWVTLQTPSGPEAAIAFAADRTHARYARALDADTIARHLAEGEGVLGRARDYLFDTAAHLRELGIRDRALEAIEAKVRGLCGSGTGVATEAACRPIVTNVTNGERGESAADAAGDPSRAASALGAR